MNFLFHIIPFEWKSLHRSNTLKALFLVVLGTGIYGIYFGKVAINKQEARIAEVQQFENQQFDSLLLWSTLDTSIESNKPKYLQALSPTGFGRNRHFTYYVANKVPPLGGLCLGQRDLFPAYYSFNMTDLARQMNVSELANPMKLLTGNFDLSYVIVFLFPLLIVALFYDLFATEREIGTLSLLQSQPVKVLNVLFYKGLLRLLIVFSSVTLLLLLAFLFQGISLAEHGNLFFRWLGLTFGYCLFWSAIMAGIISLRLNSAYSAMLGLSIWLILTMVTPAFLNLFVLANEPLPRRAETIDAIRTLNDEIWESPKAFVFDSFYEKSPHYNKGDTTNFDKWYYASFTLLDEKANAFNHKFEQQVAKRNELLNNWQWIAPAAMVYEWLSNISDTDRASQLKFIKTIHQFHGELKAIYYSKIFAEETFDQTDLAKFQERLGD